MCCITIFILAPGAPMVGTKPCCPEAVVVPILPSRQSLNSLYMANEASVRHGVVSFSKSVSSPGAGLGGGGLTKLTKAASAAACLARSFVVPHPRNVWPFTYKKANRWVTIEGNTFQIIVGYNFKPRFIFCSYSRTQQEKHITVNYGYTAVVSILLIFVANYKQLIFLKNMSSWLKYKFFLPIY